MEMLGHISNRYWSLKLTKELCSVLTNFAKKRNEIIICHAPLLYCALTSEFLTRLSNASLQHQNRCLATAEIYK